MHVLLPAIGPDWEFRQLLRRGPGTGVRQGPTCLYSTRLVWRRNGSGGNLYSLGDRTSDQSRLSTGTSSCRDRLCYRQTKTADLGRPIKVIYASIYWYRLILTWHRNWRKCFICGWLRLRLLYILSRKWKIHGRRPICQGSRKITSQGLALVNPATDWRIVMQQRV